MKKAFHMTRIHSPPAPARHALACAAGLLCAGVSFAQTAPDSTVAQVQTVQIKGQALPRDNAPFSSTLLDAERIRDAAVNQPEQLLRQVPGVEVRGYHLGGVVNVITIRGFSGGAHGGDLGMVIDGIPLNEAMSHSDGYADLNVIVPLEIDRMEVFRGPVSALYGNFNRGGLIAIESRRGGSYVQTDASLASFSTVDVQAAAGVKLGPGQFNGAVQAFHTGDYRPDSKFDRGTASARYTLDLAPGSALSFSGRVHGSRWDSASYLLKTQFNSGDPFGKDPRVNNDGGSKHFNTARVDFNQVLSSDLKLLTFAYGTRQDYSRFFTRPLNANTWSQREETYDRRVAGAGFSLNGQARPAGVTLQWVAGAEAYRESTDYLFFEGTAARTRTAAAVYDRSYDSNSVSGFGEVAAVVSPYFKPTVGVRWDRFTGGCTKHTETGTDPCGPLNTAQRTTPKLGLRSTVAPGLDLRASVAEGFALPPGVAKYASGGSGLKPTVFRQSELGASWKTPQWRADLATYVLTSTNEVRTVSPGVFENFGRTRRKGVEGSLMLTPLDDAELGLLFNTADAKVTENANAVLLGKQVTGVPRKSVTLSGAWRPASGWGGGAEVRRVGASAVDAANTLFDGAFTTLDLALQYVTQGNGKRWRGYARLENATDRHYVSNAFVIGGQNLVAPAAPRSLQVGLQADF